MSLSGHIWIEHDVYHKRIESWWSRLRNFKTEWWIQLFKVSNYIPVGRCLHDIHILCIELGREGLV